VGEDHCAFHRYPGRAAELGSKGGRGRSVYSTDVLKQFDAPKTAADLHDLLALSIIEIRAGKLDPKLANSISYLGAGFLRALEISDLETRIAVLERQQEAAMEAESKPDPEPANNVYTELFKRIPYPELERPNATTESTKTT
jgi:hypothetical protein